MNPITFEPNPTHIKTTSGRHTPWPARRGSVHGRCDWSWRHLTAQRCRSGPQSPLCTFQSPQRTAAPSCRQTQVSADLLVCICRNCLSFNCVYSLEQSLGLARRIVRSEVLVLLHLLLYGEQLTLQLGPQTRQGVPDVVGQLLCGSKVRVRWLGFWGVFELDLVFLENLLQTLQTWLRTFWR